METSQFYNARDSNCYISECSLIVVAQGKPQLPVVIEHLSAASVKVHMFVIELSSNGSFYFEALRRHDSLNLLQIPNYRHSFNKSRTLNLALSLVSSKKVIVCDADVLLPDEVIARWSCQEPHLPLVEVLEHVTESATGHKRHAPGILTFPKKIATIIGGYYSGFKGWGCEDLDFLNRLQPHCKASRFGDAIHLTHGDAQREMYYEGSSVSTMRASNHILLAKRNSSLEPSMGSLTSDLAWWHTNYPDSMITTYED